MNYESILRSRLAGETNLVTHTGGRLKFALVYPNLYRVGMSNLGVHIIYALLNSSAAVTCERFFLPEIDTQPLSMESLSSLNRFQVVGFALSFEPDYFNAVKMLRLSKIPLMSKDRTDFDPIIIAGGCCATFNPAPMSKIVDAFVVGEGEEILPPLVDEILSTEGLPRRQRLERLSQVAGVFVPAFPKKTSRRWVKVLDAQPAHTTIVTDETEFDMYLIETARGCGRHCRFCMAGYCFRKPRNRSLDVLKDEIREAKPFGKKLGLMGAAISDYPQIDALCDFILGEGLTMSVASFRADSVTQTLVDALVASGQKTLTIAPEVGSDKMRAVVNKGITEAHVFNAVELGLHAGIKNFRLYFMVGLPFEEPADVEAIADLTLRLKKFSGAHFTLSVNPFVPKPFTPFQRSPFAGRKYLDAAIKLLRKNLRGVEMISESVRSSTVQAILSRGDEKLSDVLAMSTSEADFRRNFKASGLDENFYLGERSFDLPLPWNVLDQGFTNSYLVGEFNRARELKLTARCFDGCKRCGVCN